MKIRNLIFGTLFLAANSFAQTSAPLVLKAQVAQKLGLTITPLAVSTTLPLNQSQVDLRVASGTVVSNVANGFKVVATSANLSNLKRLGGNELFPYTMKFGAIQIPLSSATPTEFYSSTIVNMTDNFTITYNGKPIETMTAGEYQDIVTFTITAR